MLKLKKISNEELTTLYNKIYKVSETQSEKEYFERLLLSDKIQILIEEAKKSARYKHIVRFDEISVYKLESEQYKKERLNDLLFEKLRFFYAYEPKNYMLCCDVLVRQYNAFFNELEQKKDKIKFNLSVLDNWQDLNPSNLYQFFNFLNNCLEIKTYIPKWDFNFWDGFKECGKIYFLTNSLKFKVLKNGKIEIWKV